MKLNYARTALAVVATITTASLALLPLGSCIDNPNGNDSDSVNVISTALLPIAETEGIVGDGTTMNALELVTDKGDTLQVELGPSRVVGGVSAGERVSVIYSKVNGQPVAAVATNLTALQHLWTQRLPDGTRQSLEINPGGYATTYDMGDIDYDGWSVKNGQLLLHQSKNAAREGASITDTFDILLLNEDTLVIGSDLMQAVFRRDN